MIRKILFTALPLSILLSGWYNAFAADTESKQIMNDIKSEVKTFVSMLQDKDLNRSDIKELEQLKIIIMAQKSGNQDVKNFISFFSGQSDFQEIIADTLGNLSDEELVVAYKNNQKRNLEFAGDISKKVEAGKQAAELTRQVDHLLKTGNDVSAKFVNTDSLQELIISDYEEDKLNKIAVTLGRVEGDPKNISLTFKNNTDSLFVTDINMSIVIKAEGRDVPLYQIEHFAYPFLSPLKPGEEIQEIISCRSDCQKAMSNEKAYGEITLNELNARIKGSNRIFSARRTDGWVKDSQQKGIDRMKKNNEVIKQRYADYLAEKEKIEALLK